MDMKKAELFKVLGVDTRIRIIELLKQKGPLGANEMSEMLKVTPSAVSQHLKILKHAGLVQNERKGYWIPYRINADALERCGELLSSTCSCGCKDPVRFREAKSETVEDKVTFLEKYEMELREELNKVRTRLGELKKEN